jgi:phospholipase C
MKFSRRNLLSAGAAMLAAEAYGATIAQALAIPANTRTGTIRDVEHVVIFMQENRSFDHYFGALRGVRGFGDPRVIALPSGEKVWRQPDGKGGFIAPFRLNARTTSAEIIPSLDHSWKGSHARWKHHDAWIGAKTAMTMGYFTREDLPFYYALADAFTICDAYYCSIFGPTNPNRLYLFSGTNGPSVGQVSDVAVRNPLLELNNSSDPGADGWAFPALTWKTYAERLQERGVSWKVYQEYDNYGDNGLAYFKNFRGAGADRELMLRGRGWAPGSTKQNAKSSRGEHLVAQFSADVRANRLPQVSWIVAPEIMCEHPAGGPSYGQSLTARLLAALVANPEVYSKTVFLLNYDENDGFFDHAPPYLPATGTAQGASTVSAAGENYRGEPIGLGPRVPMLIVSPWSKGGWVNSEVFDHTSVLQFLERRFDVEETNISPWRRSVCGDLTSAFDFTTADVAPAQLPDTSHFIAALDARHNLPRPLAPEHFAPAVQEGGQRPARALPYYVDVRCELDPARRGVALAFDNAGGAGAPFQVYAPGGAGPWFYTIESRKHLRHQLLNNVDRYDLSVFGPNGSLSVFRGAFNGQAASIEATTSFDRSGSIIRITLRNTGSNPVELGVRALAYSNQRGGALHLRPGESLDGTWDIASSGRWYDIEITAPGDASFLRRFAGHRETGAPSVSDPMIAA